jgi:serine protease DegQ
MSSGPGGPGREDPGDEWDDTSGGWVPPEHRAWRHPSELFASATPADPSPRQRDRGVTTLAVGTAAAAAVVIGALLLVSTGTSPRSASLDTMPVTTAAITPCCRLAASTAGADEAALVSLQTTGAHPRTTGCGVVVGDGQLLATTLRAVGSAHRLRAVAATGKQLTASLVATDQGSGIALLRLSGGLPVAPVDHVSALGVGASAMAVSMDVRTSRHPSRPHPVWTSGVVESVGAEAPTARDMAAIAVRGRSVPAMPGEALVDVHGGIVGILVGATGEQRDFLPMQLVVGVSNELETMGRVRHGWLDVRESTPHEGDGALVVSVKPGGAAARVLRAGDVIVSLDGSPVSSAAQLRSLLYVLAPGTKVDVAAVRGDHLITAVVQLSPSP